MKTTAKLFLCLAILVILSACGKEEPKTQAQSSGNNSFGYTNAVSGGRNAAQRAADEVEAKVEAQDKNLQEQP